MLLRIALRIVARLQRKKSSSITSAPKTTMALPIPYPATPPRPRPRILLSSSDQIAVLVLALQEYQATNESLLHGWEVKDMNDINQLTDLLTLYGIAADLESQLHNLNKNLNNDTL